MRISDWSSDVCSSDLAVATGAARRLRDQALALVVADGVDGHAGLARELADVHGDLLGQGVMINPLPWSKVKGLGHRRPETRSEEHTSELQSLMRISYAVFCFNTTNQQSHPHTHQNTS